MSLQTSNDATRELSAASLSEPSTRCLSYDDFRRTYDKVESGRRQNFSSKRSKLPKLEPARDVMVSFFYIEVTEYWPVCDKYCIIHNWRRVRAPSSSRLLLNIMNVSQISLDISTDI